MPVYMPPLSGVLAKIKAITAADPVGDLQGQWFRIKAATSSDSDTYGKLASAWDRIVGGDGACFALLYWPSGPYTGVWLHFLSTDALRREFACGCHKVDA